MNDPNNKRPKPGRAPFVRRDKDTPPGGGEGRGPGTRPFRGARGPGRSSNSPGSLPGPRGPRGPRGPSGPARPSRETYENPHELPSSAQNAGAVPNDPIASYITERGNDAAAGPKPRFISSFSSPEGAEEDLAAFLSAVAETFPLQNSRRKLLKDDVLSLWRDLTSERSLRSADYMGKPASLAAYVRYFMAWNVVRLVPVLASLPLDPPEGAVLLDIGSGPLTLPIALWIARPDLRDRSLRVICTDRVRRALESGASILDALRLKTGGPILGDGAWKIETRHAVFPDTGGPVQADIVASANAFSEFFWKQGGRKETTLGDRAARLVSDLASVCKPGGKIFLAEPGEPRSGAMLSALREAALLAGLSAESPCPHARACPMPGSFGGMGDREDGRAKSALPPVHSPRWRPKMPWCHFPVPLDIAPAGLVRFSEEVGLPKERLTVSWLALGKPKPNQKITSAEQKGPLRVRLISDPIALPGGWDGRYSCSDLGYTLVVGPAAREAAGSVLELERPARVSRDEKSGAVLIGP